MFADIFHDLIVYCPVVCVCVFIISFIICIFDE